VGNPALRAGVTIISVSEENLNSIFKAYDVRGVYPSQINVEVARRIGQAYAAVNKPRRLAIGGDVRASTVELKETLITALREGGVEVSDIGTITTDQLYFAVGEYGFDGGISVTASHNPGEYNGFKFSSRSGAPITSDGLLALRDWASSAKQPLQVQPGKISKMEILEDYINHVVSYIDAGSMKPLKIVANANFGAVGRAIDKIADKLGLDLTRLNWQEDGTFPKGPPNPLLPENRDETIALIKQVKPDFGVAWDADADRVFFFTGDGKFIHSCYIIALLAEEFLTRHKNAKIVHDITTSWVIDDVVRRAGGRPVTNRTGHTFMKARMRQEDAPFAGESSGHYYFRDSFYADNGIVPFLLILQMISRSGKSLDELVSPLTKSYKVSGEINFTVDSPNKAVELVEEKFGPQGKVDKTDGVVIEAKDWRVSVRPSNTEPLLRLNAEAHDQKSVDGIVAQISELIKTG
jgi:phosphomannomutase